jgi:hypothetical protein
MSFSAGIVSPGLAWYFPENRSRLLYVKTRTAHYVKINGMKKQHGERLSPACQGLRRSGNPRVEEHQAT